MNYTEKAAQLHASGYNCAQAVAIAFADVVDMSEEELFHLSEAFGLGGGCMQGSCGAIAGAQLIIGLNNAKKHPDANMRPDSYKKSRLLMEEFKEKNGSVICKDLKGAETGEVLRACRGCVTDAAKLLEKLIEEE